MFLALVFLWPCLELSPFTAHRKLVCACFTLDLSYFPAFKYNKEEKESMLRPLHWRTWDSRGEQRAPCLSDCKHWALVRKTESRKRIQQRAKSSGEALKDWEAGRISILKGMEHRVQEDGTREARAKRWLWDRKRVVAEIWRSCELCEWVRGHRWQGEAPCPPNTGMSWRLGLRTMGLSPENTTSQSERLTGLKLCRALGQVGNKTFSTETILIYIPACI